MKKDDEDMTEEGIYLSSFGGSGENGRNCHLIGIRGGYILLDCGVKREICGDSVGFYPELTREIVSRIQAVFLSHCHEDHVAALPLLYELGYEGLVYGTAETLDQVPGFINKWMSYVDSQGGTLPFGMEKAGQIRYARVALGEQEIGGFHVTAGRSGHVLGGCWYMFSLEGKKILYTGDMCLDSSGLAIDLPGPCDGAIMNCAYAGNVMNQAHQYRALLDSILETVHSGGKVLLPVPSKGRGIDILIYLEKNLPGIRLYAEQSVADSRMELSGQTRWIKPWMEGRSGPEVTIIRSGEERKVALRSEGAAVYLTPDGMITTPVSLEYYEFLKGDYGNKIIITGHAALGTMGYAVLDKTCREQCKIRAIGEKIVFKVHMDDDDVVALCSRIRAREVILFHSGWECTGEVVRRLEKLNVCAKTLRYPEAVKL